MNRASRAFLVFAAGVGLLLHRLQRTPEQKDLTH